PSTTPTAPSPTASAPTRRTSGRHSLTSRLPGRGSGRAHPPRRPTDLPKRGPRLVVSFTGAALRGAGACTAIAGRRPGCKRVELRALSGRAGSRPELGIERRGCLGHGEARLGRVDVHLDANYISRLQHCGHPRPISRLGETMFRAQLRVCAPWKKSMESNRG